jgi:energy-coupling factor transporter ATP-binding protein EcfA2
VVAERNPTGLIEELPRLAAALESLDLRGAAVVGRDTDRVRDQIVATIRSYLIPRLETPEAPFLVVVAGPTGAGKSTLVNTLAGLDLAVTGPVRPTTSTPLVIASSGDGSVRIGGVDCRLAIGRAPMLDQMSLVDTPDFDSTATGNREQSLALIDQADVVVFVTSALRYADSVPWEVLRRARSRGAMVIPVLNRVGPDGGAAAHDFGRRLGDAGFDEDPVRVPEHHIGDDRARVPSLAVRELRRRLYRIAQNRAQHRREMALRVLNAITGQARGLMVSVTDLAAELDSIEASILAEVLAGSDLPRRNRPWADFPLPQVPSGRRGRRRWLRRSQPALAELTAYRAQVLSGLAAELHGRLLESIVAGSGPVRALGAETIGPLSADSRRMVEEVVDVWLSSMPQGSGQERLASAVMTAASLHRVDDAVALATLGPDHPAQVSVHRKALEERMVVAHEHFAGRLAEKWRSAVGDPEVGDLANRLSAVTTAYQFADA